MTKDASRTQDGTAGVHARQVAAAVLTRVDQDGAYANLALRHALERENLDQVDSKLVTDLVYGTIRRQRSCDALLERFVMSAPPPTARTFLRLGAYQIAFRDDIPNYAAVSATVSAAPKRFRGFVNAVLRKVAGSAVEFRGAGERLSYPDWIIETLVEDLGEDRAMEALASMNESAAQVTREDGYTQDPASQMVIELLGAEDGEVIADLCSAPGGKATGISAQAAATVLASDLTATRVGLLVDNAERYGRGMVTPYVADALQPALRARSIDRVLLDAPCSGFGVLRRRADARWRVDSEAPQRLAEIQKQMIVAAASLLKPGGVLLYSVCTLTAAETTGVDDFVREHLPELQPDLETDEPWERWGRGAILLPQREGTDGMSVFRYRYSR